MLSAREPHQHRPFYEVRIVIPIFRMRLLRLKGVNNLSEGKYLASGQAETQPWVFPCSSLGNAMI